MILDLSELINVDNPEYDIPFIVFVILNANYEKLGVTENSFSLIVGNRYILRDNLLSLATSESELAKTSEIVSSLRDYIDGLPVDLKLGLLDTSLPRRLLMEGKDFNSIGELMEKVKTMINPPKPVKCGNINVPFIPLDVDIYEVLLKLFNNVDMTLCGDSNDLCVRIGNNCYSLLKKRK